MPAEVGNALLDALESRRILPDDQYPGSSLDRQILAVLARLTIGFLWQGCLRHDASAHREAERKTSPPKAAKRELPSPPGAVNSPMT
jgi:hypothetical protein